jgi:hypothetical protein
MLLASLLLAVPTPRGHAAEQEKPKLPHDAQAAMDAFAKTQAKLDDEYQHKLNAEREKLYIALDKSLKEAAKRGDADAIVAIKDEQKKLVADANKVDEAAKASGLLQDMAGTWDLAYSNGASRKITIAPDGAVHVIVSSWSGTGFDFKIALDDKIDKLIGTCDPVGHVESYCLKNGRLAVEFWATMALCQDGAPPAVSAMGTKAKDDPKK